MTETLTGAPARNWVGGEWRDSASGQTYEKRNPWRPSVVTGVYAASDAADANAAVDAAAAAFPAWASLPAGQRAAFFFKAAAALESQIGRASCRERVENEAVAGAVEHIVT